MNDNPPEFQPSNMSVLLFQVQEESGVNTIIATLEATDPDQREAGQVQFFVSDEDKEGLPFSVSPETGRSFLLSSEILLTYFSHLSSVV